MPTNCNECQSFIDETERLFGPILERNGFTLTECDGEREGHECRVMVSAKIGWLLFVLQDGAAGSYLGRSDCPLPRSVLIHGTGDYGWYETLTFAEVEAGRALMSRQLMAKFVDGHIYDYEWEAGLLAERIDRLFRFLNSYDQEQLQSLMLDRIRKNEGRWD